MAQLSEAQQPRRSAWTNAAIGIILILAGVFVLGDLALATIISALVLGIAIICAGFVEIALAIWAGGWRGFLWQTTLGILYVIFGFLLISLPALGSMILIWLLGVVLMISGLGRISLGLRYLSTDRWMMLVSGLFGLAAGFLILIGWPSTGVWVIGAFVGIDLILHAWAGSLQACGQRILPGDPAIFTVAGAAMVFKSGRLSHGEARAARTRVRRDWAGRNRRSGRPPMSKPRDCQSDRRAK
ncbi:HdeD family acid-resistance protein [Mesorhizobium sp. VK25A]|uniref:HdeD family acid-resistance protein n=1 Tax=Mesorhizobium vachelliae TaxID=3072309 RepID=A0ABU5A7I7_9HYPH|nr:MULTISPECIES: HdeD family acid-resistance protein [unclassified Mesorhizobium]MDX8533140.1 HdeD family acid-resistance protein [Mesorhizobium sp. VK25D]MDX8545059.1 HdeD family acid-resistance protein [Mesorhizobium sp. VK25A]